MISETADLVEVDFTDRGTGVRHHCSFTKDTPKGAEAQTRYTSTWTGWILNREETPTG